LQRKHKETIGDYIQSFQNGEEKGFSFFFREYHAALCYFSFSIIKDKDPTKDIVSDAFTKLWERHAGFDNAATIRSFLYTVVHNASIDWLRLQKKKKAYTNEIIYLDQKKESHVLLQMIEAETYREILSSLNALPPKCREIFRMIYFEGKDYAEIARELKLSVNTIRVQKARALAILRQQPGLLQIILIVSVLGSLFST
jgi:RNA polymerase sigma-70 factor (family 1)